MTSSLVGSEMCIRDRWCKTPHHCTHWFAPGDPTPPTSGLELACGCLLYTSDAADDMQCVDCRRYAVCRSRWSPYH
eukprot:5561415-Prorocentrum_lima.AAC.1